MNLQNAGKIDGATYFASQDMSVSDVLSTQVTFAGTGSISLSELLKSNKYNRVFLMIGMNDLTGDNSGLSEELEAIVETIEESQETVKIM